MDIQTKTKSFVDYVISRIEKDSAFRASMSRADNEAMEERSWEYLINWCDISNKREYLPYALISANIAKNKIAKNGFLGIGQALRKCYKEKGLEPADPGKARLRRLLACEDVEEACTILRPILSLVSSKQILLNYEKVLTDLLYFSDVVKQRWAVDFYQGEQE